MDDWMGFLIFAVIAALVIGGIGWAIYAEKQRREQLQEAAEQMGLTFYRDGDSILHTRLSKFKLFNIGRSRKIKNVIMGDSGEVKIAILDYQYTTGSGKNSSTHMMTIASIQSDQLHCPPFTMRTEGMFDKIGSALGFQDIDFDEYPEFSRMFVLQSPDETGTRNFFQEALIRFFENKKGISVEAESGMMFFYRPRKRVKPAELKDLLSEAYEVYGHMVDADS